MKKKLLYPGSSDTFENRQAVKATLASINAKTHKLLEAAGRQTPPPKPDRGPKNNVTYSLSEINKDIKEWMFEADMVLTPEQAKAIDDGQEDTPARSKRACITNPSGLWNPAIPINYTFDSSLCEFVQFLTGLVVLRYCIGIQRHQNEVPRKFEMHFLKDNSSPSIEHRVVFVI
ncbi:unnamed protein product [Heligmosomoides polygyrus]|uniref:DDE_Tnp_1_7 domain-containing protein n=1 Tax=Heligmosomoides polygyrus TaxID=6339 RepID=A0A183F8U1_HELPZ|nr:unnamed protein product [Heligmosomoides polygyrus]